MILGQPKLTEHINKLSIDNFPRSLILLGEIGCGKHLLCDCIAKKLSIEIKDISNKITQETIEAIYENSIPYLYLIDSTSITDKEENALLKLIEEPLRNSFIVILCTNKNMLLHTILARCQVWSFENYSKDFLEQFIPEDLMSKKDLVLKIASTPGQLKSLSGVDFQAMFDLANKVIDKIGVASFPNTLTLADKVAFKEERDKFNVRLFTKVLSQCIVDKIKADSQQKYYKAYEEVVALIKIQNTAHVDQRYAYENFLTHLWHVMRGI